MYRFSVSISCCFLYFLFIFNINKAGAQKQNNTWYFGKGLGMTFNNGVGQALPAATHAITQYIYSSSVISDKETGQALFYSNGDKVYNRNHQVMSNGLISLMAMEVLIVPDLSDTLKYFLFCSTVNGSIYYSIIDMRLNGGLGDVTIKNQLLATGLDHRFTAVKQYYDAGYWLITHVNKGNEYHVFSITGGNVSLIPIVSKSIYEQGKSYSNMYEDMIASSNGEMIAYTLDTGSNVFNYNFTEISRFDKRCGTVQNIKTLVCKFTIRSIAFDANAQFLYASTHINNNSILQYKMSSNDTDITNAIVATSQYEMNRMKLAPDNKIYVTTEELLGNGYSPSRHLHIIHNPEVEGSGCNFQEYGINLSPFSQTYLTDRLPGIILDRTTQVPTGYEKPKLKIEQFCLGSPTTFQLANSIIADSVRWDFGDTTTSSLISSIHLYKKEGKFPVRFSWFLCSNKYYIDDTIKINAIPFLELGSDTSLCAGTSYTLNAGIASKYLWSTGDITQLINVKKAGLYSVISTSGQCSAHDTISVNYFPDIWTLLGDEYFICDKENELVKLDAGEGFQTYKWLPTGDTTQWINVAEIKDYFVIVKDFRGCEGNDGTKVKRRCPVQLFFPNAFTPNGDGINDYYLPIGTDVTEFQMTIYNRWGEKVFETNSLNKMWDGMVNGKLASTDVYVYKAIYKGYFNKQLKTFDAKGNITLIR